MTQKLYDITVNKIDGTQIKLGHYKGKVLMIVNVASKCGLTPQYAGLEALHKKYESKGLIIFGFPANEFLAQEPGSNTDIQEFCRINFGVQFPLFEKIVVKGEGQHPLYELLTEVKPEATMKPDGTLIEKLKFKNLFTGKPNDVKWNFEKFLINKQGEVIERFSSEFDPQDPTIVTAIERELAHD